MRRNNADTYNNLSVIEGDTRRDSTIDILKGIGIILVVLGHADFPFRDWVYLFHMALFFITSGYLCVKVF